MIYPDGFTTKRVTVLKSRHLNFMAFGIVGFNILTDLLDLTVR
jgi:hypothetical protein